MSAHDEIISAVDNGEYEISYEEPNNFCMHHKADGSVFYVLRGDDAQFGVSGGSCTVKVAGYEVTFDLGTGDEDGDSEIVDDEEVLDAVKNIDGVLYGEMLDPDQQAEVYALANHLDANDLEVYWYEDDDIPKDAEDIRPIEDCDEHGTAMYKGKKYVLCEDIDEGRAHACALDAKPDNGGCYPCVLLHFNQTEEEWEEAGEENIASDIEETNALYDPDYDEVS